METLTSTEIIQNDTSEKNQNNFLYLLSSCTLSNLSDGMSLAFLPLISIAIATNPVTISSVDAIRQLPILLFAIPAGIMIDKVNRATAIFLLNILRFLSLLWFAYILNENSATIVHLFLLALILGSIEAINDVALPTVLPLIVKKEDLSRYNGIISSSETTANYFIGRSLGSTVSAISSNSAAVFLSAILYILSSISIFPLIKKCNVKKDETTRESLNSLIRNGFKYVFMDKKLRYLAFMGIFGNAAFGAIFATLILFITKVIKAPTWAFGPIQGAFAVGSIILGLKVNLIIKKLGMWKALLISVSIIPASFFINILLPYWPIAIVSSFLNGASAVVWNNVSISYRQSTTPDYLLGRTTATFRLLSWGSMPVGSFLGGIIINFSGYTSPYYLGTFLAILNIPFAVILWKDSLKKENS